MEIKAYARDNIKMHHIASTEKYGITFSCILYDTFTINLEEDKENNYEYKK